MQKEYRTLLFRNFTKLRANLGFHVFKKVPTYRFLETHPSFFEKCIHIEVETYKAHVINDFVIFSGMHAHDDKHYIFATTTGIHWREKSLLYFSTKFAYFKNMCSRSYITATHHHQVFTRDAEFLTLDEKKKVIFFSFYLIVQTKSRLNSVR